MVAEGHFAPSYDHAPRPTDAGGIAGVARPHGLGLGGLGPDCWPPPTGGQRETACYGHAGVHWWFTQLQLAGPVEHTGVGSPAGQSQSHAHAPTLVHRSSWMDPHMGQASRQYIPAGQDGVP